MLPATSGYVLDMFVFPMILNVVWWLQGISNRWTGIWNQTMEWKMKLIEHTQLQLTCVTGAAQSRLNYLVYLSGCYLTVEGLWATTALPTVMLLYPSIVPLLAHYQMLCYCSLAKPDSRMKNKGSASQDYSIVFVDKLECAWWQKLVLNPQSLRFGLCQCTSILSHS